MKTFLNVYLKNIFFGILTIALLLGMSFYLSENVFILKKINISIKSVGKTSLTVASIEEKLKSYINQPLWQVNLTEFSKKIKTDNRISTVRIYRSFPNNLKVIVTPSQSVFNILSKNNRLSAVAEDGSLIASSGIVNFDKPIMRGKNLLKNKKLRVLVMKALKALPKSGSFRLNKISEVSINNRNELELITVQKGHTILLDLKTINKKVKRVEKVLDYLNKNNISVRVIDGRFTKKVVVRLRNEL